MICSLLVGCGGSDNRVHEENLDTPIVDVQ